MIIDGFGSKPPNIFRKLSLEKVLKMKSKIAWEPCIGKPPLFQSNPEFLGFTYGLELSRLRFQGTASYSHHFFAGSTCRRLLHAVPVNIIHRTYIISYLIVLTLNHLLEPFLAKYSLSLLDLWSRPWGVARLLASAEFLHASIPRTGSVSTNQPRNPTCFCCIVISVEKLFLMSVILFNYFDFLYLIKQFGCHGCKLPDCHVLIGEDLGFAEIFVA